MGVHAAAVFKSELGISASWAEAVQSVSLNKRTPTSTGSRQ